MTMLAEVSEFESLLYLDIHLKSAKGFLFGLKIPFLPDFLLDHTLLGEQPSQRLKEHYQRWTQFISGLWQDTSDITYALRFDLNDKTKNINTYFIGKLQGENTTEKSCR